MYETTNYLVEGGKSLDFWIAYEYSCCVYIEKGTEALYYCVINKL
jgi:hypothetical protein